MTILLWNAVILFVHKKDRKTYSTHSIYYWGVYAHVYSVNLGQPKTSKPASAIGHLPGMFLPRFKNIWSNMGLIDVKCAFCGCYCNHGVILMLTNKPFGPGNTAPFHQMDQLYKIS